MHFSTTIATGASQSLQRTARVVCFKFNKMRNRGLQRQRQTHFFATYVACIFFELFFLSGFFFFFWYFLIFWSVHRSISGQPPVACC